MTGPLAIGIDPGTIWDERTTCAYLAGLVDGEGYVGAKRRLPTSANKSVSPKYSVCVSVAMTDRAPIDMLARFCNCADRIAVRPNPPYKTIFQLDVENLRAEQLLRRILPFMIVKKERAQTALELAELRAVSRQHRTRRMATSTGISMALSPDFLSKCEEKYQALLVRSGGTIGHGVVQ